MHLWGDGGKGGRIIIRTTKATYKKKTEKRHISRGKTYLRYNTGRIMRDAVPQARPCTASGAIRTRSIRGGKSTLGSRVKYVTGQRGVGLINTACEIAVNMIKIKIYMGVVNSLHFCERGFLHTFAI